MQACSDLLDKHCTGTNKVILPMKLYWRKLS